MSKKISVLIIALMMIFTNVLPVSAANTSLAEKSAFQEAYDKAYEEYKNDPQFQMMIADYGTTYGEKYLAEVAKRKLSSYVLRGGGGNECYQYVPYVGQTKTNNCGSATVIQTLYGMNSASNVSGATNAAKIATIDSLYDVDNQGSLYVWQVSDALYNYRNGNQVYIFEEGDEMSVDQFESNIATSLTYGKPVVLHARTQYLSYYGGKSLGHYISLDYVNRTSNTVRTVDCNYAAPYAGVHNNVPLNEAYNSISADGRYLIY